MCIRLIALVAAGLFAGPAWGQPKEWADDFTAVTTYDSASLLAPCYGGPPTKYTIFDAAGSDIFNERVVSGGGRLTLTNRSTVIIPGLGRFESGVLGGVGLGIGCPGEPPPLQGTDVFTNDDICIYVGHVFNPWQLTTPAGSNSFVITGPDGQPGMAGVDDDLDGTTDETDETLGARPTTVGGGYGNADGTGFAAGQDAAPGNAGVDDDGNGTTDDVGETGWAGSDDGDDTQRHQWIFNINANIASSESMYLSVDPGSNKDHFSIREIRNLTTISVEFNNEIAPGFHQPYTHYNWVFCVSGTCYGAMLWTSTDLANPDETVGPVVNTYHNGPNDFGIGFAWTHNVTPPQFLRRQAYAVNQNFSRTFWVCSGPPTMMDFANGIFGYPSPSADLDNDRDVDVNDFLTFSGCFAGSLAPPAPGCQNADADLDDDGDVDVNDFLTFSSCFNGSLQRPSAVCFPPDLTACGS